MPSPQDHQKPIADALMKIMQDFLLGKGLSFTKDPEMGEREVVEYESRMRVMGMEKFNGPCFVAAVNFYRDSAAKTAENTCGVFILFIHEDHIQKFFKLMQITGISMDDDESVAKGCGQIMKELANILQTSMPSLGYGQLIVSDPICAKNDLVEGVNFPYELYTYYELSFYLWKTKAVAVDVMFSPK